MSSKRERRMQRFDKRPKHLFRPPLAAIPAASSVLPTILPTGPDLAKVIDCGSFDTQPVPAAVVESEPMSIAESYRAAMQEFCAEIDQVILRAKQRFMLQGLYEGRPSSKS